MTANDAITGGEDAWWPGSNLFSIVISVIVALSCCLCFLAFWAWYMRRYPGVDKDAMARYGKRLSSIRASLRSSLRSSVASNISRKNSLVGASGAPVAPDGLGPVGEGRAKNDLLRVPSFGVPGFSGKREKADAASARSSRRASAQAARLKTREQRSSLLFPASSAGAGVLDSAAAQAGLDSAIDDDGPATLRRRASTSVHSATREEMRGIRGMLPTFSGFRARSRRASASAPVHADDDASSANSTPRAAHLGQRHAQRGAAHGGLTWSAGHGSGPQREGERRTTDQERYTADIDRSTTDGGDSTDRSLREMGSARAGRGATLDERLGGDDGPYCESPFVSPRYVAGNCHDGGYFGGCSYCGGGSSVPSGGCVYGYNGGCAGVCAAAGGGHHRRPANGGPIKRSTSSENMTRLDSLFFDSPREAEGARECAGCGGGAMPGLHPSWPGPCPPMGCTHPMGYYPHAHSASSFGNFGNPFSPYAPPYRAANQGRGVSFAPPPAPFASCTDGQMFTPSPPPVAPAAAGAAEPAVADASANAEVTHSLTAVMARRLPAFRTNAEVHQEIGRVTVADTHERLWDPKLDKLPMEGEESNLSRVANPRAAQAHRAQRLIGGGRGLPQFAGARAQSAPRPRPGKESKAYKDVWGQFEYT